MTYHHQSEYYRAAIAISMEVPGGKASENFGILLSVLPHSLFSYAAEPFCETIGVAGEHFRRGEA